MKKLYFDMEFTGLHKGTTTISLGIVSECGSSFYAEFADYDRSQVDDWLKENVISKLTMEDGHHADVFEDGALHTKCCGDSETIKDELESWLSYLTPTQRATELAEPNQFVMVSDCMHYDMVLFLDIWGGATMDGKGAPACIYYIPIDICTMFIDAGIDPDIDREFYGSGGSEKYDESAKHNALHDAMVIKDCYERLSPTMRDFDGDRMIFVKRPIYD